MHFSLVLLSLLAFVASQDTAPAPPVFPTADTEQADNQAPPAVAELWRLPGLSDAHPAYPTVLAHAAALAAQGFTAAKASTAHSFHTPYASAKAHTFHHPGVGYISLNYTAGLHPDLVHLDEFSALLRELNASWDCAAGPSGTTIGKLLLGKPSDSSAAQVTLVLAYLAGRLGAPNATLAWGERLFDMEGLWGSTCDAAFENRTTAPFFDVLGVGVQSAGSAGGIALAVLLAPCPALRLFSHIKMATRVVGNETRARELFPDAPTAPPARRMAPNPDPTQTGTGNQVSLSYSLASFNWNYGGSLGVAAVNPLPLIKNVPTSQLGCTTCYAHLDLSVVASLDFCSPTGWASCYVSGLGSVYLREFGAYLEGVADVRGTFALNNPTLTSTSTTTLLPKRRAGSLTLAVAALPLTIYLYFKVELIATATATIEGTLSYSASYYQQANLGAAYNYVMSPTSPVAFISQFNPPTISVPPVDFSGIRGASAQLTLDIQPTVYMALWDVFSIYMQVDPNILVAAGYNSASFPTCNPGLGVSLGMEVSCIVGMEDVTWEKVLKATNLQSSLGGWLSGTLVPGSATEPIPLIPSFSLIPPICYAAAASASRSPAPPPPSSSTSTSTPSPSPGSTPAAAGACAFSFCLPCVSTPGCSWCGGTSQCVTSAWFASCSFYDDDTVQGNQCAGEAVDPDFSLSASTTPSTTNSASNSPSSTTTLTASPTASVTLGASSSNSATAPVSRTPSETSRPTMSATPTKTLSGTGLVTASSTSSLTLSVTPTPTSTMTGTPSLPSTRTASTTLTGAPTASLSLGTSASVSPTKSFSSTATPSRSPMPSPTATRSGSGPATATSTVSPASSIGSSQSQELSSSLTPSASLSGNAGGGSSSTQTPTASSSSTQTPTPSGTPTSTVSDSSTLSSSCTSSLTIGASPSNTATPLPSLSRTQTPTSTVSSSSTLSTSCTPSLTIGASPSNTASLAPIAAPSAPTYTSSNTACITLTSSPMHSAGTTLPASDILSPTLSPTSTPTGPAAQASAAAPTLYPALTLSFALTLQAASAANASIIAATFQNSAPSVLDKVRVFLLELGLPATPAMQLSYTFTARLSPSALLPPSVTVLFTVGFFTRRLSAASAGANSAQLQASLAALSPDATTVFANSLLQGGRGAGLCTAASFGAFSASEADPPQPPPAPAGMAAFIQTISTPGAAAGLGMGGLVLVALAALAVYVCLRRRRKLRSRAQQQQLTAHSKAEAAASGGGGESEQGTAGVAPGNQPSVQPVQRATESKGAEAATRGRVVFAVSNPMAGVQRGAASSRAEESTGTLSSDNPLTGVQVRGVVTGAAEASQLPHPSAYSHPEMEMPSSSAALAEPPLPAGWVRAGPTDSGHYWYDHPATLRTQWERPSTTAASPEPSLPDGWVRAGPTDSGHYWYDHPATLHTQWERPSATAASPEPPLPDGWVCVGPDSEGKYYYDNPLACLTQWERPSEPIVPPSSTAMEVAALVWNNRDGELPPNWDFEMSSSGDVLFITPEGVTTWEDPRENWHTCKLLKKG